MDTNNAARMACVEPARQLDRRDSLNRFIHFAWRALHKALTLSLAAFLLCASAAKADDIDYAYDESGRLVQASNRTSGEAVRYTYDAVGNITSQISGPLSTLAVGHFTPRRGPIGTQVTIKGTGFSSTPAANVVFFSGVQATVVSSSQTQIVAAVPASATSGTISVQVGEASVASAESFTVTATSDELSITAVLPNVSSVGNIVTIVGTNFEPVLTQNRVRFSNALADVIAATATTITTRVPIGASSGQIRVTTPRGVAVSPTDFVVFPPAYTADRISSVQRVSTDGSGSSVSFASAGKIGLRLFEGKAGELLTIGLSGMSFASTEVRVFAPDNSQLARGTVMAALPGLQLPKLKVSGTYTIVIDPNAVGSVTVGVFPPSLTALTVDGAPTTVSIAPPGRRARLTFNVPADTYANVVLSSVTLSAGTFSLIAPSGAVLKSQTFNTTGMALRPLLKRAGTYTLLLDPTDSITGSITAAVTTAALPSLTPNAAHELTISNATPLNFTFRGEPGQYLTIATQLNAPSGFSMEISVQNPDGSPLTSRQVGTSYTTGSRSLGSGILNFGPLTSGGTFAVTVQRSGGTSSTAVLTLTSAATGAALSANGSTSIAPVVNVGQSVIRPFTAAAGQFLSLAVVEQVGSMHGATAKILKPDGTELGSVELTIPLGGDLGGDGDDFRHGSGVVNMGPLPMTGTYRVLLQQRDIGRKEDSHVGSWELVLSEPLAGNVAVDGGTDSRTISVTGQGVLYRFSGTAGEYMSVGMSSDLGSINEMAATVLDPDGLKIAEGRMTIDRSTADGLLFVYGSRVVNMGPLPASGTYTLFVQQLGYSVENAGRINITLSRPAGGSLEPNAAVSQITIDRPGQGVLSSFSGSVGQYRTIRVESADWITAAAMKVLAPDGSVLPGATATITTTPVEALGTIQGYKGHNLVNIGPLTTSGTYQVLVQQTGSGRPNTGMFSVRLSAPVTGTFVALHVNLDKTAELRKETFTA